MIKDEDDDDEDDDDDDDEDDKDDDDKDSDDEDADDDDAGEEDQEEDESDDTDVSNSFLRFFRRFILLVGKSLFLEAAMLCLDNLEFVSLRFV